MTDDLHALVAGYALDALDRDDQRAFEKHLAVCERCREELAGLREAAAALAFGAAGPAPPPELKGRILAQASGERQTVVPFRRRTRDWTAQLAAAAAVAACAALALGIWAATLKSDLDAARSRGNDGALVAVLAQRGARVVPMSGGGKLAYAPSGSATLVVNVSPAPSGKTYEAWVIEGGKPRRAALFRGRDGASVIRITKPVRAGSVVAVTVERSGGVEQPTRRPLMATGTLA
jgi:anti-sigma-K factor RskA